MRIARYLARRCLAIIAIGLSAQAAPVQAAELTIGQVAPYSGPLAPTGLHLRAGIQLYFDVVNAAGGIHGNRLRLVSRDDGYKAAETVKQLKTLIETDKPLALVGLVGTSNVAAVLKEGLLERYGVPVVGARTGAAAVRDPAPPLLFHTRASYAAEVEAIVKQMKSMGVAKVGVFYQDDAFGKDGLDAARRALAAVSIGLVAEGAYPRNTTDVTQAVDAIAAANPTGVIMVSNTAASSEFVKQFRGRNIFAQLIALSVTDGHQVAERVGHDLARGLGIVQVVPDPVGSTTALAREVRKAWEKHPQKDVELSHTLLEGFLMAKVLVEGLNRSGNDLSARQLAATLDRMQGFDTGGLTIGFSPQDHSGPSYTDITVLDRKGRPIR